MSNLEGADVVITPLIPSIWNMVGASKSWQARKHTLEDVRIRGQHKAASNIPSSLNADRKSIIRNRLGQLTDSVYDLRLECSLFRAYIVLWPILFLRRARPSMSTFRKISRRRPLAVIDQSNEHRVSTIVRTVLRTYVVTVTVSWRAKELTKRTIEHWRVTLQRSFRLAGDCECPDLVPRLVPP